MSKSGSLGKRKYLRDGRAPIPRKEITSRIMSSIGAKNTTPELLLRKALRAVGLIGYRLHYKKAPGRPDIAYPKRKLAIFVHGCFWHRCPYCKPSLPKTHLTFWREKFKRNKARDKKKENILKKAGWRVIILWECKIQNYKVEYLSRIRRYF